MKFLHSMIRVLDLDKTVDFFVNKLGLIETRRKEYPSGRFTLVYLATSANEPEVELTYNWDQKEAYPNGRAFGHLAFEVDNIYELCQRLERMDVPILRPPRDGKMAFVKTPDGISIELLQKGSALVPSEPWSSRPSQGEW